MSTKIFERSEDLFFNLYSQFRPLLTVAIILLLFGITVAGAACSKNEDRGSSVDENSIVKDYQTDCHLGFCYSLVDNRTDINSWRLVHICVSEDDFSIDNVRLIVRFISDSYPKPSRLIVGIDSDPNSFKQGTSGNAYSKPFANFVRAKHKMKLSYTASIPTDHLTLTDVEFAK